MNLTDLTAGDRVSAFVWTGDHKGASRAGPIYLTVVRVNRVTATVRYEDGHTQRIGAHLLNAKVTDEEFNDS